MSSFQVSGWYLVARLHLQLEVDERRVRAHGVDAGHLHDPSGLRREEPDGRSAPRLGRRGQRFHHAEPGAQRVALHVDAVGDLGQFVDPVTADAVVRLDDPRAARGQLDLGVPWTVAQPHRVEEVRHQPRDLAQRLGRAAAGLRMSDLDETGAAALLVGHRDDHMPAVEGQGLHADLRAVQELLHEELVEGFGTGQVPGGPMPVEGSEPFGDDVHVGSVADAEHPQAARFADRLDDDREPVRLNELPNVLRGTADRGGHRADAPRGQVPAHPPLVRQQFHGGDGLAAEAERLVDPRRRQQPELEQRHGRLEPVRLVQRLGQWQEPVDVAVVEQQRLIDVGPVAAVILVRELGVNHVQAELPGLAHMLELAADDQDARPSGGDRRGPLAGGYDIVDNVAPSLDHHGRAKVPRPESGWSLRCGPQSL